MRSATITQIIAELEQSIRDMQAEAARPGKGQALAQLRLERRHGALEIIEWCRANSDEIRAFRKAKGEGDERSRGDD